MGLDERWSEDGNGLSGASGEDGDNAVMIGFEDSTQKLFLIVAGK